MIFGTRPTANQWEMKSSENALLALLMMACGVVVVWRRCRTDFSDLFAYKGSPQSANGYLTREGQFVHASPEELTARVGTERGKKEPVHIASEGEDLIADLKRGLSYVRRQRKMEQFARKEPWRLRITICVTHSNDLSSPPISC